MRHFIFMLSFCIAGIYAAYSQPVFKGGQDALKLFVSGKIVYPEYSRQNCISGTIQVRFTLDTAGNVAEAKIFQGLGIDLDDEALRVVKLTSGKWVIPANYNTSTQLVLPVNFTADQTRCGSISNGDIEMAIQAYKNRQGLEDVVTHYYKSKYAGKADTASEAAIISIKNKTISSDEKQKQGDTSGACENWLFIRNIGSTRADKFIDRYCK
ncbi:MAG: TonB family protein [Sphingobacteriales bacterium]|nr:MAG: TonB family protein [Sphingobacteriales bacterium]